MRPRQMLDDGQPQARPSQFSGTSAIHAIKSLEEPLQMLRRYSFASILNEYSIPRSILMSDNYATAFSVELNCVVDKVRQHLLEPTRVGKDFDSSVDFVLQNHSMN